MQDSEILDLIEADHKRIDRKYATDPSYILRKRVANTAGDVIRKIQNIAFEDLTAHLQDQLGEDFLFYDLKVYYLCPECRKKGGN